MLTLALALAPTLTLAFFKPIIGVVCGLAILFWLVRNVAVPEPFNFVLYAIMAFAALWLLFYLLGGL